jgi:glutamine amidotransferase
LASTTTSDIDIVVIDYHRGNLRSVQKGLQNAGANAYISDDSGDILKADASVLPGVGSFADAADMMRSLGQTDAIRAACAKGHPFLGICLGIQLLFDYGDEGAGGAGYAYGLGLLSGYCRRIDDTTADGMKLKVPHVGWNQVTYMGDFAADGMSGQRSCANADGGALFRGIPDNSNFYFTHSYQCVPADGSCVTATTTHATAFTSAVQSGNIFGVQFHPEKSSHNGARVLANFVSTVRAYKSGGK